MTAPHAIGALAIGLTLLTSSAPSLAPPSPSASAFASPPSTARSSGAPATWTHVSAMMPWTAPTPPEQPENGPGGKSYAHARFTASRFGTGAEEVLIFEPAEPTPERAPVVVFCHGWAAMDPVHYGAWITHIVRRGYTVVYPRYQADVRTRPVDFTRYAVAGVRRALDELRAPGHVPPDDRGIALVGHSMGGLVAANLAALGAKGVLPRPLALMSVEPGKTWPEASRTAFPLEDLAVLPPALLLVAVAGDDDDFVRDVDARKVYLGASNVAAENKNYVRMFSDEHGSPTLRADHRAPTAPATVIDTPEPHRAATSRFADVGDRGERVTNALDYYGTWKLFDGLSDAVFRGVHREYALGNTPQQRYMGEWSDRMPVRELMIGLP